MADQSSCAGKSGNASKSMQAKKAKVDELMKLARSLGFICIEARSLKAELGNALGARMVKRSGENLHQMVTVALPYFPRMLLEELIPEEMVVKDTWNEKSWTMSSMSSIESIMSPILGASRYVCSGSSKAFQTKSQPVIRLVAKLLPDVEITHHRGQGLQEKVHINTMYALVTEHGEIHWPKDEENRELSFTATRIAEVRRGVLKDLREMGDSGHPLSAPFWLQLGEEEKAKEVELQLLADLQKKEQSRLARLSGERRVAQRGAGSRGRYTKEKYKIDQILAEKQTSSKAKRLFLVRWSGYDPSWELYRISGQPGEPIETWEPLTVLAGTQALRDWRVRQAPLQA